MRTRYGAYLDGLVSRGLPGDWLSGVRISAASNKGKGVNSMICPRYIVFDDAPQDRRLGWTADHLLTHCAPRSRRLVCASSDNTALDPTHTWPAFKFADGRAANTTPNSIRSTTWSMCHEASGKEGIAERPGRLWVSVKLSCLAKGASKLIKRTCGQSGGVSNFIQISLSDCGESGRSRRLNKAPGLSIQLSTRPLSSVL